MPRRSSTAAKPKTTANLLSSPLPLTTPPHHFSSDSPKPFDFDLKGFTKKKTVITASASVLIQPRTSSPAHKSLSTILDLKDLVSSQSGSIKRSLDLSHSQILKEFEASHSRLSKRFKIHTQACQQVMDEADKDYKKLLERVKDNAEMMKVSYSEFITELQASAAHVSKTSIPELTRSMEKSIEGLRNRYGMASASA